MTMTERDHLEGLIDKHGLKQVLLAIAELAIGKSIHIQDNQQDRELSRLWSFAALAIEKSARHAPGEPSR
jgi:hypothetical protein